MHPPQTSLSGPLSAPLPEHWWRAVPPERRIPLLIEILQRYRDVRQNPGRLSETNPENGLPFSYALAELTEAAYRLAKSREGRALRFVPDEAQSLTILRTAYHTCGHGKDVKPPLELALRHYRKKPYSDSFFDAAAAYRNVLAHTKHTATQTVKAALDLILWQDFRQPRTPKRCFSEVIRQGIAGLSEPDRSNWRQLCQTFVPALVHTPSKVWRRHAEPALQKLGARPFGDALKRWVDPTTSGPDTLTATGSHVLKCLIWTATLAPDPELNETLHALAFRTWKPRQPIARLAIALAYLWTRSETDREVARLRLTQLVKAFGYDEAIEKMRQSYFAAEILNGIHQSA